MLKSVCGTVTAVIASLALAGTAAAQVPEAKCQAAKEKCLNSLVTGLLGCYSKDSAKPDQMKLDACVQKATDKFTGAEIEAVFCEALHTAFHENREPSEKDIELALTQTVPISKTMATEIEALRTWANGRARRASPVRTISLKSNIGSRKL